jgi:hypothetical protein
MSYKICGLESFHQADARIIPDKPSHPANLVTGNFRASLVILSAAKDLLFAFLFVIPEGNLLLRRVPILVTVSS